MTIEEYKKKKQSNMTIEQYRNFKSDFLNKQTKRTDDLWTSNTPIQSKLNNEVEMQSPKTNGTKSSVGSVIGKTLATPVAALGQLGTGVAMGLEGAMDFGTTIGVGGINALRNMRIQTIGKELEKLNAQGEGNSQKAKALQKSMQEAISARDYSNKKAEEFIAKEWVQDSIGKANDEFTEKYSYLPVKVGQITKTVGNMLPSIANAGSIAKSLPQATTKLGQLATKGAAMLPFMAQAAGSSTEQALNEGANLSDATKYGLASGAIEGAIESISGGIGGSIGGKLVSSKLGKEAIERITKNALGKFALRLVDAGIDVFGEGFEEVLSTAINPLIQRMTYDEQAKLATSEELMQSFIDGVLSSMLVKGGQAGLSRVINRNNANFQENEVQNQVQTQNIEQGNVTLPTQAEMAQNTNMGQITQTPNLPTQKAQKTLQSAKIAGMTDMDMQKAIDLNNMLRSGANLEFYDAKNIPENVQADKAKIANGFYKDGTLWINKNSKNKVEQILGHELTHHLETTDSYTDLSNTILDSGVFYDFIAEKGYTNVAEYKTKLKEMGYTDAQMNNEMVARFVEEKMFTDQKSIDRLARQNTKLVEKIKNWISDLVVSFKGTAQEKELRRIENMYRKALEQARNTTASNTTDVKYHIKNIADFNETEYNNIQEMQLSPKEYGKLAHIVDTDPSIKPGVNRVSTSDATYVIYQKEYNDFKVVDKYEGGVDNDAIANGNIRGIDNARNGSGRFQVPIENTRNKGTTKGNDELLDGNTRARSVKVESDNDGISNKKSVAGKEPAFSLPENIQEAVFDEEFYDQYKNEDRSKIKESIEELEKLKATFDDNTDFHTAFDTNAKIKALKNGNDNLYDYYIDSAKQRIEEDYKYNPKKYEEKAKQKEQKLKQQQKLEEEIKNATPHKREQYNIIQETNPAPDEYHTWIRSPKDIKTFEEVVAEEEGFGWGDFDIDDAKEALRKGTIRVYSSYPIKNGTFVSTSYQQALDYAGGERSGVHSRVVALDSVAWINGDEGQYAKVYKKPSKVSFSLPETDNQGRTLSKEQQEFFKDSKVRDENGKLQVVYHGTGENFTVFSDKFMGKNNGNALGQGYYFSSSRFIANSYKGTSNGKLMEVYLNIQKPFDFFGEGDLLDKAEYLKNKYGISQIEGKLKFNLHALGLIKSIASENNITTSEILQDLGYDGIISGNEYIAFEPNQIKNVDNTNPTENPDIRYSMNPVEVAKNTSKSQEPSLLNEIAPIDDKKLETVEEKETTASILTKSPKRPAKDLLKQSVDVVMRKLVDAGNTINTVGKLTGDKHLYEYFNNTKQARQSAEYMIGEAQTDIKGNRVGNSLIRIFEEVRSKGDAYTNEFFEYLLHMHNIDRMAQNKPVFGASVTAEDSRRVANQLLEKHPEFEKQANKVYAYNRNLMQWRVDSGLISKEQADLMNEMYPHYVPTFRDVSGTSGSRAMQSTVQIANTVRKATGSNKDIMPIDASMARQTMQTVQAAKRNLLGNRLLNDALNNKDKVGEYIQAVEKTTEQNDLETELDTPKDTNLDSNNNVFKIFRNGETYVMQVNNGIYEGLKSISSEIDNTDANLLLKPVKAANNMFKKLITGYSPMFSLKNFSRDIQDSGLYSKELRKFIKKYPNTYKEMMGNGKMWQLYKSLGGTGSSFFDYETGIEKTLDSRNKVSTKIKEATLGKVEELNMMVEQAPRFAEFMATIEKAGNQNYDTLMEAMLNAADITVNFGRSGTWGKALNSTAVPFFNPSIQGFDKLTRTVLESKDGKKFAKLAIRATLLGILPSVINELLYWDDEEYENLTDRDKDTNFLIKTGDNKWLKIPKGRVLSIFGNTAARGLRTLKGEKWDAGEYLKNQASQTAPISVFDSNLYSPIQAVQNNKTWYGSDIVPQRLQDYAPKDQYDENTDAFSKWLGGKINYSPKKINYLIDAYTGIIGDVALPLTTPKAETNPFTKAFVLDGVTSNEISNDFYNMLDKYNPKQNPKKSAKEVSRYLNKQSSQVSDIYKQIREVENSDISDDKKRKQVRELRELANTIELTAMATVPEYEKAVDKYRGTFADEDVDSDYAYLFANRDVFGAEYAVKTFSKSLYNNHKDENMNTFFRNYFTREYFQKKLEPKETKKATKNTLPTLSQQRAKLPTLKK